MDQRKTDTPEQVIKFAPKEKMHANGSQLDETGQAIVAQIRTAADLTNEDCDRAMSLAHKLSMELRAAEDRTHQMKAEVELWRDRAGRAEQWLRVIQKEIEDQLIAPKSSSRAGQPAAP
jgi:nucleotide-binding universal stress UspA family protein